MNVILISLDTQRADHLSGYGYHRLTSPHLDRYAEGGTLFERCYCPHLPTHPSHTGVFTGTDPMRHQVISQGARTELSPDIPMLAELLRDQGYFTGAADNLGRWFARGFQLYEGYSWAREEGGAWRKGEAVTETALRVLDQAMRQPQPFFVFIHYWDPHTPYLPPAPFSRMFYGGDERDPGNDSMAPLFACPRFGPYFRRWLDGVTDIEFPKAEYDASIRYMDTCLQHLFQRLADSGLEEDTLVVIMGDHGEELDEHAMWFDHHGLYDTNLHVPLILRQPGRVPAGKRLPGTVRLTDIFPTILEALNLSHLGEGLDLQGRSVLPLLADDGTDGTGDTLYLTENTWMRKRGLRTPEWKLIVAQEPDFHNCPSVELYNLQEDGGEQTNLADERPEVVDELKAKLFEWVERRRAETGLPDPLEKWGVAMKSIG